MRSGNINIVKNRFVFVIPGLILFTLFALIPIFSVFVMGFTSWDLLHPIKFVGLRNFKNMLHDKWFWNSILVSFKFMGISVPLIFVLSLALAIALYKEDRFSRIFRAFFYWPYMIPAVVGGTMWKWLLSYDTGLLNYILLKLGLEPISWLEESTNALISVSIAQVWILAGFMMMIFITGLQNIPSEYQEAAFVDGATKWQVFWYVIFPLLKNTNILVLIVSIAYCFRSFTIVYIMTTGGPGYATTVAPLYIYQRAFTEYRIGYASALSAVVLIIALVIALIVLRVRKSD
ncbi:MAG: alpha,4-digalacturonate transport system permease protein [Thermotogaceae bacterium]|jgi:alpha-1,4-digalacturonate transport system permease protein|nr:alpha,4-digalacturonate transport system permease protein [Thermotogaceae bacterium]